MATRTELRGFLKSQRTSEIEEEDEVQVRSGKECESDELVKYMSKLPGYLERSEESNVLNVGVLDWGRLEKWKDGRGKVSTTSGVVVSNDDKLHTYSNLDKGTRDLEHSVHGVRCTLEPELACRGLLNNQQVASCSYRSSSIDLERVNPGKSRKPETSSGLSSEMGNSGGSLRAKIHSQEARERAKECVEKLVLEEMIIGDAKAGLTCEKQEQESHQCGNIVLLRSRKKPQMSRDCPRSLDLERDSEDTVLPLGVDVSAKKERFGGRRHSKMFDEEIRQDDSRKNIYPSPSKRFSFSFGRLSRSFTFKEDSPTLTSYDDTIKSASMRFDGSEKQNGSRVSPLRRLLDPLLKPKGFENVLPPLQDEKTSRRTQALFQLTVRNGIPLFQFLVDDNNNDNSSSRSILGATMQSSVSSFKDDSVQYCTFYSVNEVRKKKSGSWLRHGHKEKQHGFVYNVIGQMRLNNSMSLDITENMKESVLFDESEQVKGRKEVAAVVIKKKPVEEKCTSLEDVTVIIPGGVHSFPEKGAPSTLISRWRSGGLCDCGGWDVGCKLHVLSNKTLREFDQSFKLFHQEGSEQDSGPVLAMKEVKTGIYRVEFGSFVSPLQAFFVCVTVITCGSEDTVLKTTGKSPFAPPLSPVGRV